MGAKPKGHKNKLKTLKWLDPRTAINFAYAIHSANNPDLVGTEEGVLAEQLSQEFRKLLSSVKPGTPDHEYLVQVQLVVLSHARGITRRKLEQLKTIQEAQTLRDEHIGRLQGSRGTSIFLNILYTKAGMAAFATLFMGAIGYFLAQTIGTFLIDFLPDDAKSGRAPSILSALFFGGVGKLVSTRLSDWHQDRIQSNFEHTRHRARIRYERGKLEEITLHSEKLETLWKEFVGTKYPRSGSYAMVIKGDVIAEESLRDHTIEKSRSLIAILCVRAWNMVRRQRKTNTLEQGLASS